MGQWTSRRCQSCGRQKNAGPGCLTRQMAAVSDRELAQNGIDARETARLQLSLLLGSFVGAPMPEEPTKSFLPSGNVMSRPLARLAPSLAWKPSTRIRYRGQRILVPAAAKQRVRRAALDHPALDLPSASFTSMWIQECGLIHSIFVDRATQLDRALGVEFGRKRVVRNHGTAAAAKERGPRNNAEQFASHRIHLPT